jgi:hypothetical protein
LVDPSQLFTDEVLKLFTDEVLKIADREFSGVTAALAESPSQDRNGAHRCTAAIPVRSSPVELSSRFDHRTIVGSFPTTE